MSRVRHVVLVRFKPETPAATIDEIMSDIAALRDKIPGILDYSGGAYSSPEGLHKGFTHGFTMTFVDQAARDAYLPHPDHQAVYEKILPQLDGGLDGAVAFDWVE